MIEKRKAQRLDIPIKVKYRLSARDKILRESFCHNVSGSGMQITSDCPFKKGERLKSLLYFPGERKPVTAMSKIAWCRRSPVRPGRIFDVGIKHVKVYPQDRDRFVFLFCEMMVNYLVLGEVKPK